MSIRVSARSSSNSSAASALASSVLPTPVGPRNRNEPVGRSGSEMPARARRTASDTARTASAWPTRRSPSAASMRSSLPVSPSSIRPAGMPVHADTTAAMSSGPTCSSTMRSALCDVSRARASSASRAGTSAYDRREAVARSPSRWAFSTSVCTSESCRLSSPTRFRPAFSCSHRAVSAASCVDRSASSRRSVASRSTEAASLSRSRASSSICIRSTARWSSSTSTGRLSISIRSRDPASSTRSMALSGRKRAEM